MRILVCASEAPIAPLNGMRAQLRALVEHLAGRHDVTVVAARWPGQVGDPPAGVDAHWVTAPPTEGRALVGQRARSVLCRRPVDVVRLAGPMAGAVGAVVANGRFDVAHVGLAELADVAPALGTIPAVLVPLDAWTLNVATAADAASGWRRRWLQHQRSLVETYTAHAFRPFRAVVLVSDDDAAEVRRADPTLRTVVIPNGVDAEHFRPDPSVFRDDRLVVFTGALHTPANVVAAVELATQVLPAVRVHVPDARLALVGRRPDRVVQRLALLRGVEVVADVPDIRPWLRRAGAFATPMASGTGIKNKLLEAMACGAPCVTTVLGARGLVLGDGGELVRAESPGAMAAAIADLLGDRSRADRLGAAGRRHVLAHHGWASVAARYEALYTQVAASGPNSAG